MNPSAQHRVYLTLGSNRDAEDNLPRAVRALASYGIPGAVSSVYETVPVGTDDPTPFLNAALELTTTMVARQFKSDVIAEIERHLGRVRDPADACAPRSIDIDIAFWDDDVGKILGRPVPDPDTLRYLHLAWPLAEIAPDLRHPVDGRTLAEIARELARSAPLPVLRRDVILDPVVDDRGIGTDRHPGLRRSFVSRLRKKLIVVGDRLLVRPEEGEERTGAGLYLPQTAVSARQAQGGWVVSVGPGVPIPEPIDLDEDWADDERSPRYMRLQAQEGDYCLFLKKAAVEITFEKKSYLIVPNSAVLVLVREDFDAEQENWEKD